MNTRERILSIKLMERQKTNPEYFKGLGITASLKERVTRMNAIYGSEKKVTEVRKDAESKLLGYQKMLNSYRKEDN